MEQKKEYYAFISYKREDEKWAQWLQDKLEHYKFPTNLNGHTDLPRNIRPTFRDVTDLNPGLLAEEIDNALRNSEWLIVVCSPRSAKSPWVCKEAQTFIDLGRADRIIPFVIEGYPFSNDTTTECYPEALLNLTDSKELLAANINEMGRDAAAIKVVARMFNLRFDALWQRHEREQRRKKWIWIGGSAFLALLGLGIGGYFVKQNRIIENQNIQLENATNRLREDSVILANHISRIQADSVKLVRKNDSIRNQKESLILTNRLLAKERNNVLKANANLYSSNQLLTEERNNVLRANVNSNVSLFKTYLAQNRPEMALVVLNNIGPNVGLLDSMQYNDLLLMKESLCDSILKSSILLADVRDIEERKPHAYTTLLKNSEIVNIQQIDDMDVLHIYNKENNLTDTILGEPKINYLFNRRKSFIATYVNGDSDDICLDTLFTYEKAGIRIYSLQNGRLEHFIGCWGYQPWMTYPMSLSNNGTSLIYHEGQRSFEGIWYMDFENGQRSALHTSYSNTYDYAVSSFSPNDNYFYLYYPKKNIIDIYSTHSLDVIHTFKYENCDSVYWDSSDDICISTDGKIYSWKLSDSKKNLTFNVGSFANGVNISNGYAAVTCNDGKIYIWDILSRRKIFEKEIMDAPEDVTFTKDETQLWVVSGYNCVNTIDIKSKRIKSIYVKDAEVGPHHPWKAYLYMTKNGEYCISRCYYGDQYSLFDIKGNVIKTGVQFDEYIKRHPDDILSEFVLPEEFDYDPELTERQTPILTARRVSSDGKVCIEGYSNGAIKVFSIQERNSIRTLIMEEDSFITK